MRGITRNRVKRCIFIGEILKVSGPYVSVTLTSAYAVTLRVLSRLRKKSSFVITMCVNRLAIGNGALPRRADALFRTRCSNDARSGVFISDTRSRKGEEKKKKRKHRDMRRPDISNNQILIVTIALITMC